MLTNLQLLRAFAAINVIYYHTISIGHSYGQDVSVFSFLKGWGGCGVDIFFTISGFVILYSQTKNPKPVFTFLKNRAIRIIPLYWFCILFIFGMSLIIPSVFKNFNSSLENVIKSLLFIASHEKVSHTILYVGWTLEWEIIFYIIFTLGLCLKKMNSTVAFTLCTLLTISLSIQNLSIISEFGFGMLCAILFLNQSHSKLGTIAFSIGVLMLISNAFIDEDWVDKGFAMRAIPSFLITYGAVNMKAYRSRLFEYLGEASYSIYLVQVFTISAFYKFSSKYLAFISGDLLSLACLIFTCLAGCLMYVFLEKPMTHFFKKRLSKKEEKLRLKTA